MKEKLNNRRVEQKEWLEKISRMTGVGARSRGGREEKRRTVS